MMKSAGAIVLLLTSSSCRTGLAFAFGGRPLAHSLPSYLQQIRAHDGSPRPITSLHMTVESTEDVAKMRLGEVKSELKQLKISYADCFDAESLRKRLVEARDGFVSPEVDSKSHQSASDGDLSDGSCSETSATDSYAESESSSTPGGSKPSSFDREATLAELRTLRVKELRTRLSERNIRWAGLLEKEDLVRSLTDAMERASNFSPSGALKPGKVADINEEQLDSEINKAQDVGNLLLLDVYATWCGPCQMMAPQLSAAAAELGQAVRVAKIDSDLYPNWASKLRVGGLPTVLVFDASGKEVDRVEGALMKEGLLDLVRRHI